jgi:hypothetical protein
MTIKWKQYVIEVTIIVKVTMVIKEFKKSHHII